MPPRPIPHDRFATIAQAVFGKDQRPVVISFNGLHEGVRHLN